MTGQKRKRRRVFAWERAFILWAIVPCILYYLGISFIPVGYAFYLSLHKYTVISPPQFIGFQNYVKTLADPAFQAALRNTFVYTIVTVPIGTVLSLFLAVLITNVGGKLGSFFRVVYYLPTITSLVAMSFVWKWLYQPNLGLFNQVLRMLGLPTLKFLQSPTQALPSLMLISIWRGLGYNAVILMAGLQGIPHEFYDAAMIDGANAYHIFRKITIPLLRPTLAFVLIIGAIGAFQVFTEVLLLTRGGPLDSTRTIVYDIYQRAFDYFQMGYASAAAFILFAIILLFTYLQLRLLRTHWEY